MQIRGIQLKTAKDALPFFIFTRVRLDTPNLWNKRKCKLSKRMGVKVYCSLTYTFYVTEIYL